jgi:DNA-directed RNA polymerase subunit RPC12/RpoP
MDDAIGWARLWPAAKRAGAADRRLRQGAWYPVVSRGASRLVLEVSGERVAVPHDLLEVRSTRPDRFTVVYRTRDDPNPARDTRRDLGRVYAVCPVCAARVLLARRPYLGTTGVWVTTGVEHARCRKCGHEGVVAWWETG